MGKVGEVDKAGEFGKGGEFGVVGKVSNAGEVCRDQDFIQSVANHQLAPTHTYLHKQFIELLRNKETPTFSLISPIYVQETSSSKVLTHKKLSKKEPKLMFG